MENVRVERGTGDWRLTSEDAQGEDVRFFHGNEEQLHSYLCRNGWVRTGAWRGDPIAGLYVRKSA